MDQLSMEKFSPKKAELKALVVKYKLLTIDGVDDRAGYQIVGAARKDLQKKRGLIKSTGKEIRDEAIKYQRAVIALEKELVEIIQPLEDELKAKQEAIDLEIIREERKVLLPERRKQLEEYDVEVDDETLLDMAADEFQAFYLARKEEFLAEKERIQKEKDEAAAAEKEKARIAEQAKKEAAEEVEKVKKEAKEKAERIKKEAKEEKERAVQEAKDAAAAEKKAIEEKHEKEEADRVDKLAKEKAEREEKEMTEAAENAKMEKRNEYIKFLADNGHSEETKGEFTMVKTDTEIILYKKVGAFNYKI